MLSHSEENSPLTEKGLGEEEHEGHRKIVDLSAYRGTRAKSEILDARASRHQDARELHDTPSQTDVAPAMTDEPSREEVNARLEAVEARTEARFAQLTGSLEVKFTNLDNKMDRIVDSVSQISVEINKIQSQAVSDNKTTRSTMIVTAIASVVAIIGILLTVLLASQNNLLSAFQAGLAVKAYQSQSPSRP